MQIDDPNKSDSKTPMDIPPMGHKVWFKRKWLIIAASLALSSSLILVWFISNRQTDQQQLNKDSSAASVLSYEDCLQAKGSTIDEEGGICTTIKGVIFRIGEDYKQINVGGDEELTKSSRDQSVKLIVGYDDPAFLHGSPYLLAPEGESVLTLPVTVITSGISLDACTLSIKSVPDNSNQPATESTKIPMASENISFIDGQHTVVLVCTVHNSEPLRIEKRFGVADRKPELCSNFDFKALSGSSVPSAESLRSALNGTWKGCVNVPSEWGASYYVTLIFSPNSSYTASSDEVLDGTVYSGGFYHWNVAGPHIGKTFGVASFSGGQGLGYLDIIRPESGSIQRGELKNIKLSDQYLSFDFKLTQNTKELHFNLKRVVPI